MGSFNVSSASISTAAYNAALPVVANALRPSSASTTVHAKAPEPLPNAGGPTEVISDYLFGMAALGDIGAVTLGLVGATVVAAAPVLGALLIVGALLLLAGAIWLHVLAAQIDPDDDYANRERAPTVAQASDKPRSKPLENALTVAVGNPQLALSAPKNN